VWSLRVGLAVHSVGSRWKLKKRALASTGVASSSTAGSSPAAAGASGSTSGATTAALGVVSKGKDVKALGGGYVQ
jgi:hypothetical protein